MEVRAILREALALLVVGVALVLALSLYSYHPGDPSLNHATTAPVRNLMGLVGSYTADMLYQLLGLTAWLLVVGVGVLAWRIAKVRRPLLGGWMAWMWLPFVLAVAGLLQAHVPSSLLSLPVGSGGVLGKRIVASLSYALHALGRDIVLLTLALSSFVAAARISLLGLLARGMGLVRAMVSMLGGITVRVRATAGERKARLEGREQRRKAQREQKNDTPRQEPEIAPPAEVRVSTQARQRRQAELALKEPAASGFKLPGLHLFSAGAKPKRKPDQAALQAMARMLEKKLLDYRVKGQVVAVQPGPVVTQFELEPAPGTKVSRIIALQDDLARAMAAVSVRVAGNIPGKSVIGIEIPNEQRETVSLHEVMASEAFADKRHVLPLALGVDIAGHPVVADLAKMPHLLVAGTTGSGKSVSVNSMICSLLMTHTPADLRLILVDPKMLELSIYDDIPHLLVPVVTNPHKAAKALAWAVYEMERRYKLMSEARVRNIASYNRSAAQEENAERLPYIVIIIDELADLMMVAGKEVEQSICRLAQKARAAGLHLILATQRPSVDVITGLIKANLPSRIAFQVSSKIDSRTILDQMGAEQLLGQGDSLFLSGGRDLKRVHGAFVSDAEVVALVEHLKEQGKPEYREEVFETPASPDGESAGGGDDAHDEKYDEAAQLVIEKGQCSVSMVQRYLRIGYNRASRIVEQMEREGLVSAPGAGGIRKVLARSQEQGGGVIE
ncbi:MAG: DNA translocase FtsK [Zetaproteobacteria bacterium]|nr:MAG: DNA translocase FtsK [Zetaproteobacteria bacterium]